MTHDRRHKSAKLPVMFTSFSDIRRKFPHWWRQTLASQGLSPGLPREPRLSSFLLSAVLPALLLPVPRRPSLLSPLIWPQVSRSALPAAFLLSELSWPARRPGLELPHQCRECQPRLSETPRNAVNHGARTCCVREIPGDLRSGRCGVGKPAHSRKHALDGAEGEFRASQMSVRPAVS